MSRRRPGRQAHKHLERTEAVAEVLRRLPSRGACPGPCNRGHRRRAEQHRAAVEKARGDLVREWGPVHPDWLDREATLLADAKVQVPVPRRGVPVWCVKCTSDVQVAVESFPQLLEWMLDRVVGDIPERVRIDGSGRRVSLGPAVAPVTVLELLPDGAGVSERLACGHYRHRRSIGPAPATRVCLTCVASVIVPEPGRLAPGARAARSASGRPAVSPAGSPAWLELDDSMTWLASAAEAVRVAIGLDRETYDARTGSTRDRYTEAVRAAQHLGVRLDDILSSPLAESFGRDAVAHARRLLRLSGMDDLVHRLEGECPVCQRRALQRANGADRVRCSSCWASWAEDYYQHLVRIQVWEAQHPELAPTDDEDPTTTSEEEQDQWTSTTVHEHTATA